MSNLKTQLKKSGMAESSCSKNTDVQAEGCWKVLLVDDEPDIHALFHLVLDSIVVEEKNLQLFSASSMQEAKYLLKEHPDMAVVLLDVVMETENAGLEFVQYIRNELNNHLIQIVLVTGQPGYAPQTEVVVDYDINGYRLKSDLTVDKIFSSVYVALRQHNSMLKVIEQKKQLDAVEKLNSFIVQSSEDAIISMTLQGKVNSWNNAAEKIFAYSVNEMLGQSISRLMKDNGDLDFQRALHAVQKGEKVDSFETQRQTKDGNLIDIFVTLSAIKDIDGQIVGISEISRDISERKKHEQEMQLAANVFTHAREAIIITNTKGTIINVNDAFCRITGYNREEVIGKTPRILRSGHQNKEFYVKMWSELLEHGYWTGEFWNRSKNGELFAQKSTISAVYDEQGKPNHFVALCSDITLLKEHEKELEHMAQFDLLTELPNRVLLADRLHQAMTMSIRHDSHIGIAFLDLDGFKEINDQYGHDFGDQLLMKLAILMHKTLREGDTLSRIGGDEFVFVFSDLNKLEDCLPMLNHLLQAASQQVLIDNKSIQVSASLGVTFYPQQSEVDADQLIRQADQAMYQAKLAGKNRYHFFDAEHDSRVRTYNESLERIQQALHDNEFVLYFQPKVNMRSGDIIGVEALIRWQHPEKGLLPPAAFLPVIENKRLAIDLGEWVIDSALSQIKQWLASGLDMKVSVNIGANQLQQSDFVERLTNQIAAYPDIRPESIELEVLETSAMKDIALVSETIKSCKQHGISFALDDFGTGYSSLTYLKRLPVSLLKIDQSFVRDMLVDPDDLAILEGILSLAASFRLEVIAEGVETIEHGEFLLKLGCELAQGYGIARPMPANEMPDWVKSWQPATSWSEIEAS